jgi:hypothetical protein
MQIMYQGLNWRHDCPYRCWPEAKLQLPERMREWTLPWCSDSLVGAHHRVHAWLVAVAMVAPVLVALE